MGKFAFSLTLMAGFILLCGICVCTVFWIIMKQRGRPRQASIIFSNSFHPIDSAGWRAREYFCKSVIKSANSRLAAWSCSHRIGWSTEEILVEFHQKSKVFSEDVHIRSHIDVPEYFVMILGYSSLREIAMDHKVDLDEAGIAVLQGFNVIYLPSIKKKEIEEDPVPIELD
jgi:hypothetical protein